MKRQNNLKNSKNNRSLLALAGQQSLMQQSTVKKYHPYDYQAVEEQTINHKYQPQYFDEKVILKKLTLARLRKMQALVRGFLVRRTVYPRELSKYLIATSILDMISKNILYKQSSEIVIQAITFSKYEGDETKGQHRIIEEQIYDSIIKKIIGRQLEVIVREAISQKGPLASRPLITFGFNLRSPIELILYEKLMETMRNQQTQTAEQSIREQAHNALQLRLMQQWIQKMKFIELVCEEVVDETLQENIGQYVVHNMIEKICKEGSEVVANVIYENSLEQIEQEYLTTLKQQVEQALIEEAIGQFMLQQGFGYQSQL